jgi:hypothetical protein
MFVLSQSALWASRSLPNGSSSTCQCLFHSGGTSLRLSIFSAGVAALAKPSSTTQ